MDRLTYYPAHASRPVEQLLIPGPTAWGTGDEMLTQMITDLKAARDVEQREVECSRCGQVVATCEAVPEVFTCNACLNGE